MKNSKIRIISNHYRVAIVISIISLGVIFSGTIVLLSYLNENNNNDNNHNSSNNSVGEAFEGYNLFVLQYKSQHNESRSLTLFITDMEGKVIVEKKYQKEPRGLDVYPVELFNTTTVLLGDDDGAVLWNFVTNSTLDLGFSGHHDLEYNANNNSFFTMSWYSSETPDVSDGYERDGYDWIKEYDWHGNLKWSLNTQQFINLSMWCPHQDSYGKTRDITHGNTVFYDSKEDVIYYLSRNTNTFFKIDHKTKEILWSLGEYGDFQLIDQYGKTRENLFFHAHSVEKIDTNTFILFDNDRHNQTNPENYRSRIVEITIDEASMTAYESWEWAAPVEYYSDIWGDADRLPNGNRLGTFGTQTHPNTDIGPRLVEVNDSKHILWEMNFPTTADYMYGIYRMERFRLTPTIENLTEIFTPVDSVNVSWQTWYNFRTKHPVEGFYEIYLDGQLIKNGVHVFKKWWLPSNLMMTLKNLSPGEHNVTAVIADEKGSMISDTVEIHIETTFIKFRPYQVFFELNPIQQKTHSNKIWAF
ncbi:MAG: aryl-sulfate sulfotransferase [Promethearchaeota archaeon]